MPSEVTRQRWFPAECDCQVFWDRVVHTCGLLFLAVVLLPGFDGYRLALGGGELRGPVWAVDFCRTWGIGDSYRRDYSSTTN